MSLEVLHPGSFTCLVDLGRYRFRKYGIPLSGPLDMQSALRALSLSGHSTSSPLLETYLSGLTLQALDHSLSIIISGAVADIFINDNLATHSEVYNLSEGDILKIGKIHVGARLYLSLKGNLICPTTLGSVSPLKGYHDSLLKKGDILNVTSTEKNLKSTSSSIAPLDISPDQPIWVTLGPEWHTLDKINQGDLLGHPYTIDQYADRMGYRLQGHPVQLSRSKEIFSAPVIPGTVQLLPDGRPLILMKDCQTTGGYPRVLQVTAASMLQLAQRKPEDLVRFELHQK